MRAMTLDSYGLEPRVTELPAPVAKEREVLVRVHATSVNPIDWKQASGRYRPLLTAAFPFVPGYDLAGVVEALGPGVTGFAVGQRVHTRLSGRAGGANAELVRAGLDVLRPMPEGMDFEQAAGLPLAGMTALQGLRDVGGLPMTGARQRVLIIGASGGVGHLAVQLAAAAGAQVTGVCSARNAGLVRRLGASSVIDYGTPDAYAGVPPFDLVFDCVGSAPGAFLHLVAAGGRFASCVPGPAVFVRRALNVLSSKAVAPVLLSPNAKDLGTLDALFAQEKLEVIIDGRFDAAQLAEAWKRSATGRTVGKLVVTWR